MATLKVSVTTMSTINDEIKSNRSVISSSTSSTVNISAESSSSSSDQDINAVLTSTQTTTTTVNGGNSEATASEDEKEPAGGKSSTTTATAAVVKVSQESSHRFRANKAKIYRVKNLNWYCQKCDVYCNSAPQFEVHMMSQKHKMAVSGGLLSPSLVEFSNLAMAKMPDESKLVEATDGGGDGTPRRTKSETEAADQEDASKKKLNPIIEFNLIATQCNIDATKYLIPASKKKGKFEKFGFYCSKCDAYMTGQIQLVMHVRGAKHQYFSPNEIPNYQPSKVYNPHQSHDRRIKYVSQRTNFFKAIREGPHHLTYLFNHNMSASSGGSFYKNYFYNQIMANTSICNKTNLSRHCQRAGGAARKMSSPLHTLDPLEAAQCAVPFDICFYDYFRTQELIHNQNYHHRYNNSTAAFSPFAPANFSNGAMFPSYPGAPPQLFDDNLPAYLSNQSPVSLSSPDMVKQMTTRSIDSPSSASIDYSSDQQSWPSYSGVTSPNNVNPAYMSQYRAAQQPYFPANGGYEAYNLSQTIQSCPQLNSNLNSNSYLPANSQHKPAAAEGAVQLPVRQLGVQTPILSQSVNKLDNMGHYRLVSKSFSGKLVQITPAPALNNGVSMLVMNSEGMNASVNSTNSGNQFVVNSNPNNRQKNPAPSSSSSEHRVFYHQEPIPAPYHYHTNQQQLPMPPQQHHQYMSQPGGAFANRDDSPAKLVPTRQNAPHPAPSAFSSYNFHYTVY